MSLLSPSSHSLGLGQQANNNNNTNNNMGDVSPSSHHSSPSLSASSNPVSLLIFQVLDSSATGRLTLAAMKESMKEIDPNIQERAIEEIFDKIDRDGRGYIEYGQFHDHFDDFTAHLQLSMSAAQRGDAADGEENDNDNFNDQSMVENSLSQCEHDALVAASHPQTFTGKVRRVCARRRSSMRYAARDGKRLAWLEEEDDAGREMRDKENTPVSVSRTGTHSSSNNSSSKNPSTIHSVSLLSPSFKSANKLSAAAVIGSGGQPKSALRKPLSALHESSNTNNNAEEGTPMKGKKTHKIVLIFEESDMASKHAAAPSTTIPTIPVPSSSSSTAAPPNVAWLFANKNNNPNNRANTSDSDGDCDNEGLGLSDFQTFALHYCDGRLLNESDQQELETIFRSSSAPLQRGQWTGSLDGHLRRFATPAFVQSLVAAVQSAAAAQRAGHRYHCGVRESIAPEVVHPIVKAVKKMLSGDEQTNDKKLNGGNKEEAAVSVESMDNNNNNNNSAESASMPTVSRHQLTSDSIDYDEYKQLSQSYRHLIYQHNKLKQAYQVMEQQQREQAAQMQAQAAQAQAMQQAHAQAAQEAQAQLQKGSDGQGNRRKSVKARKGANKNTNNTNINNNNGSSILPSSSLAPYPAAIDSAPQYTAMLLDQLRGQLAAANEALLRGRHDEGEINKLKDAVNEKTALLAMANEHGHDQEKRIRELEELLSVENNRRDEYNGLLIKERQQGKSIKEAYNQLSTHYQQHKSSYTAIQSQYQSLSDDYERLKLQAERDRLALAAVAACEAGGEGGGATGRGAKGGLAMELRCESQQEEIQRLKVYNQRMQEEFVHHFHYQQQLIAAITGSATATGQIKAQDASVGQLQANAPATTAQLSTINPGPVARPATNFGCLGFLSCSSASARRHEAAAVGALQRHREWIERWLVKEENDEQNIKQLQEQPSSGTTDDVKGNSSSLCPSSSHSKRLSSIQESVNDLSHTFTCQRASLGQHASGDPHAELAPFFIPGPGQQMAGPSLADLEAPPASCGKCAIM